MYNFAMHVLPIVEMDRRQFIYVPMFEWPLLWRRTKSARLAMAMVLDGASDSGPTHPNPFAGPVANSRCSIRLVTATGVRIAAPRTLIHLRTHVSTVASEERAYL